MAGEEAKTAGFDIDEAQPVGIGTHVVQQGECIYSIAAATGHDWKTIWEHLDNKPIRDARKDPAILLPGDKLHVPAVEPRTISLETGKRHRIVILGLYVPLRLRMCDAEGEPVVDAKYRLEVAGKTKEVSTGKNGEIETKVPATATTAKLTHLETGEEYALSLGHMDPPSSSSAVRKRLANLGYEVEGSEGELDEQCLHALSVFREDASLDDDAAVDDVLTRLRDKDPWRT